ncbi:DUF2294 domain-containing protein [Leptolyngbya sp. FACHB-261]|uniref:DUF2294 domain-containing protein n=1 Tax=Leptolyngbya sp. FACHB-261 TaxID=2692806 RepID=UPI0016855F5E|nr:DUF2294 domain-containing protein [Leptolyngbya sp. FACHB-261]MBD2103133.1 DUF2294 domain-containing protein [Leptolyngbya sp. FACHB-261]
MSSLPTREQLESLLAQRVQIFYQKYLEHCPSNVFCNLFEDKVAIVLENSLTPSTQLLADAGQQELAKKVRNDVQKALEPQFKAVIEEVLGVPVIDLLSNATLETGRTATIVVLAQPPQVQLG